MTITVEKLMKDTGLPRWLGVRVLQFLDRCGVGTFVVGRRGWSTRLEI